MKVIRFSIVVVTHPINTEAHPSIKPGWRWAIQVGGSSPSDLDMCAKAGWATDRREALALGDTAGAAAVRSVRMFGIPATYGYLELDYDPIPAGCDRLHRL